MTNLEAYLFCTCNTFIYWLKSSSIAITFPNRRIHFQPKVSRRESTVCLHRRGSNFSRNFESKLFIDCTNSTFIHLFKLVHTIAWLIIVYKCQFLLLQLMSMTLPRGRKRPQPQPYHSSVPKFFPKLDQSLFSKVVNLHSYLILQVHYYYCQIECFVWLVF